MLNHCSCSHGLGGRTVYEPWGGEHLEDVLAFGAIECPGGRLQQAARLDPVVAVRES